MMALRSHLFPYRTQKLSSIAPKVVGGSLPARIGRRDAHGRLAQLGEHLPYKQGVTGSIPVATTIKVFNGSVAQLVRVPACHAGGRGFEPLLSRHFNLILKS